MGKLKQLWRINLDGVISMLGFPSGKKKKKKKMGGIPLWEKKFKIEGKFKGPSKVFFPP